MKNFFIALLCLIGLLSAQALAGGNDFTTNQLPKSKHHRQVVDRMTSNDAQTLHRLDSIVEYNCSDGVARNSEKTEFIYDDVNHQAFETAYSWGWIEETGTYGWVNIYDHQWDYPWDYRYEFRGDTIITTYNVLSYAYKKTEVVDDAQRILYSEYLAWSFQLNKWVGRDWEKFQRTYDENGRMTSNYTYFWDDEASAYVYGTKSQMSYDENGKVTSHEGWNWNRATSQWELTRMSKDTKTVNSQGWTEIYYENWNWNYTTMQLEMQLKYRHLLKYDSYDRVVEFEGYKWSPEKNMWIGDVDGRYLPEIIHSFHGGKFSCEYDNEGRLTQFKIYELNEETQLWELYETQNWEYWMGNDVAYHTHFVSFESDFH